MGKVPEELFKEPDAYAAQREQMAEIAKQQLEFEQICCEIFSNEASRKLYQMLEARFITRQLIDPNTPHCQTAAIWWDGFRQAIFLLYGSAKSHLDRINASQTIPQGEQNG